MELDEQVEELIAQFVSADGDKLVVSRKVNGYMPSSRCATRKRTAGKQPRSGGGVFFCTKELWWSCPSVSDVITIPLYSASLTHPVMDWYMEYLPRRAGRGDI